MTRASPSNGKRRGWLVRLDGDEPLTQAQRRALGYWVNRSPVHRNARVRLAQHWKQANKLTELGPLLYVASDKERRASGRQRLGV